MEIIELTIHGDNVVECDRARNMLGAALGLSFSLIPGSSPQAPKFEASNASEDLHVTLTLLSGHNRWGYNLSETLKSLGSTIRENADAVVTKSVGQKEQILFAMEFCGALPAGNNAWQRHGRAYSFGQSGIPYLIYNEVGGQELNSDRTARSSRFPNPAVPFSLVMFSKEIDVPVLPVYEAAPSALPQDVEVFRDAIGDGAALEFIRALILGSSTEKSLKSLESKALEMGYQLAAKKKRADGFAADTWIEKVNSSRNSIDFYLDQNEPWALKSVDKVESSETAQQLLKAIVDLSPVSLGTRSLRFALLSIEKRKQLGQAISRIYGNQFDDLRNWLGSEEKPLTLVLITGFKPRGDDSRPDRGLTPLARMLAGQDADVLTVVWGPAKEAFLSNALKDPLAASESNGLLQSIFACSEAVLFDSINAPPFALNTESFQSKPSRQPPLIKGSLTLPSLGEHDIDTVFHFIATEPHRSEILEGMCNPPGGDWSGINLKLQSGRLGRWTSLPRVSLQKRPDHVVQVDLPSGQIILSVESKQHFSSLEENVGPRLKDYLKYLMASRPNVVQDVSGGTWNNNHQPADKSPISPTYSMALAVPDTQRSLGEIRQEFGLDFIASIEIEDHKVLMRLAFDPDLESILDEIIDTLLLTSSIEVEIRKD
jgi:hypothetical protein